MKNEETSTSSLGVTVERHTVSLDADLSKAAKAFAKREHFTFTGLIEKALTRLLREEGVLAAPDRLDVERLMRALCASHGPDAVRAKLAELQRAALTETGGAG